MLKENQPTVQFNGRVIPADPSDPRYIEDLKYVDQIKVEAHGDVWYGELIANANEALKEKKEIIPNQTPQVEPIFQEPSPLAKA